MAVYPTSFLIPSRSLAENSVRDFPPAMKTTTIVSISAGTLITGALGKSPRNLISTVSTFWRLADLMLQAYAIYFDYRRRNDPEFRKQLKRESRRQARIAKEVAEEQGKQQKEEIKKAVREAIEEGFPTDLEEKEAYFMQQISQGEQLAGDGMPLLSCSHAGSLLTMRRLRSDRCSSMFL